MSKLEYFRPALMYSGVMTLDNCDIFASSHKGCKNVVDPGSIRIISHMVGHVCLMN